METTNVWRTMPLSNRYHRAPQMDYLGSIIPAVFVIASVVLHAGFRYSQLRSRVPLAVIAVNYCAAAAVTIGMFAFFVLRAPSESDTPWAIWFGGPINGVIYFVHLLVIWAAFDLVGVGITVALVYSAAVIPVLAGWIFWNESLGPLQWIALALTPVALILMRPNAAQHTHWTIKGDVILVLAVLMAGTSQIIHKIAGEAGTTQHPLYLMLLFVTAAISSMGCLRWRRLSLTGPDVRLGVAVGLLNTLTTYLIVLCLYLIPAVVFFPTSAPLIVCLNVIVSRWLWRERISRRQLMGLALALIVVALINLPTSVPSPES